MTLKGALAAAVVLLAIWLMFGQHSSATPMYRPAVHVTAKTHHTTTHHAPTKKG